MAQTGDVAVAVVGYHSDEVLRSFLESVNAQTLRPIEVVVVDNSGPNEHTQALANAAGARYLALPTNPGYGGAMNVAVSQLSTNTSHVLICNPDVVLGGEVIARLAATLDEAPQVATAGPLIRNSDGAVYPSARAIPSLSTGVGHALFHLAWPRNPWTRQYHAQQEAVVERDCGWLSGACLLVRRSAFESIGGFDEHYFMYFEDVDLGYRLSQAGWTHRYVPSAEVVHSGAHSTRDEAPRMAMTHHESAKRFLKKRYPAWWQAPVRITTSVGLDVRRRLTTRRSKAAV